MSPWRLPGRVRRRAPRALLAWEYGAGLTHAANLVAVARHLTRSGFECLATLHDLRAAPALAALGVRSVQNHVWPGARRWVSHGYERIHGGFADVLGNLGLSQDGAVAAAIAHYDGLLGLFAPDIVLAENAYGAQLAARGRLPVVAFGFGQYLPPTIGGRFPDSESASFDEEEIASAIDAALRRAGRPPLAQLGDVLAAGAVLPFGPEAFDVYTPFRPEPALPAHVPGFRPGVRAGSGAEVFVYLQGFAVRMPSVMEALLAIAALRRPVRAFLPDADPADLERLRTAGAVLEPEPLPIAALIARSACVLHHGGVGLAAACLSAGLPQVVLSKQLDNRTAGTFVATEGLGAHARLHEADPAWVVEEVRRASEDRPLRERCRARAPDFDAWFGPDPTEAVAAASCRLLGLAAPRAAPVRRP